MLTPLEALAADPDELAGGSLEPGGHHEAVVVPHGGEALPVARVTPYGPVLDQVADLAAVVAHARVGMRLVGGIGGPVASPLMSGVP